MLDVDVTYKKAVTIKAPLEKVYGFLSDYEQSARNVPGIDSFTKKGQDHYRWVFKPVGAKSFSIRAEYETMFSSVVNKEVSWESIPGKGNTDVKGRFRLKEAKAGTRLDLDITVTAHLPLPRLMGFVARPAMEMQTQSTMEKYLQNIKRSLEEG